MQLSPQPRQLYLQRNRITDDQDHKTMAEVVGVAIGTLALLGTFKDCIELFECFLASRHLERDLMLLQTKLDVEKTLLLQWAARVSLLKEECDSRLEKPEIARVIKSLLISIQQLLGDSKMLQLRYGEQPEAQGDRSGSIIRMLAHAEDTGLSASRMTKFTTDFLALQIQTRNKQNKRTELDVASVRKRILWVVHDKVKFELLVQELS